MHDVVTKEAKLKAVTEMVASFSRGEAGKTLSADDICQLFEKLYHTVDKTVPDPEKRTVGLGA